MRNRLGLGLVAFLLASASAADYQAALPGYHYKFPRDHFDHPNYQTEWWYYTGNLRTPEGHRFGFELTFFRQGVSREKNASAWQIRDLYMAHLALSDIGGHRFYYAERMNRAGPGVAGVNEQTGLIWNGNWQAQMNSTDDQQHLRGIGDNFEFHLNLQPAKPLVIHGQNGVSQKADGTGHASHYISFTRLITDGSVELNGAKYSVDGTSWMDHEFFTESLDASETGWDWLSLQLDDNTELMLYRLRHKDGSVDAYSSGTYVDAHGKATFLSSGDFVMTPAGEPFTSPQSKGVYPIRWRVSIPSLAIEAEIATPLPSQELFSRIGPSYWEGAIDVTGQRASSPLRGVGYLEMTGYSAMIHGLQPVPTTGP